jgi:hypothetical protein
MARLISKARNPNTLLNIDSEGSLGGKFIDNELIDLGHIVTRLWWFRIVWGNAGKQLKAESAVSDLKGFRGYRLTVTFGNRASIPVVLPSLIPRKLNIALAISQHTTIGSSPHGRRNKGSGRPG